MTTQSLLNPDVNDRKAPNNDSRVIALIGFVHSISHFFHLVLPPLFPWLMTEFDLSFAGVGVTMAVFFVVSGLGQAVAGFAVDRFGALKVLMGGISCFLLAGIGLSMANSTLVLFAAAALAGLGNSVFHPADFSVLNRRVSPARLGHAFALHGLSGNLGWALAPLFMTFLAGQFGWRVAALAAGLLAVPALLLLWRFGDLLDTAHSEHADSAGELRKYGTFAFLRVGAVWMCFAFFFFVTLAFGAIQNFSTPILQRLYDLPLTTAVGALSTYLLAAAGGTLLGGFITQRQANDRVVAAALLAAACFALLLATQWIPGWAVLPVMAGIGFSIGIAGPSRDLLVRRAATARFGQAAYGRIYGFVYSGLDSGFAVAPLLFGTLMDQQQFSTVLIGVAILQSAAVLTALGVEKNVPSSAGELVTTKQ